MNKKKKLLLIGWDAADWKIINPLLDTGKMPALERLVNGGVLGNLATLDPPMSPILWTSIATGMYGDKHGILNFTEPVPESGTIRPVSSCSRKVKAIWNILSQNDYKTHVVGWWPSHPAEPINGICISNFYQRAHAPIDKPWPMRPGTVHPEEKATLFDELRVHPAELTEAHLLPFVPDAIKIDQEKDKALVSLARIIADSASIHAAATHILEHEEWDFLAVYYDAIDHFCHGFMHYHPPKMRLIPQDKFDLYKNVVTGGYLFHDMMLDRLLQLAGEDVTVVLISDHGFHSDHLRPKGLPKEPAGPAHQHRDYGIVCMRGENIKKDERVYGADLLDITPTILSILNLPIGHDMDGKPMLNIFNEPVTPAYIPSWETVEGNSGMLPRDAQHDPYAEQEAMEQLIALGYVEPPGDDHQKAVQRCVSESRFFLARIHLAKYDYHSALPLLEQLYQDGFEEVRYAFYLAKCYYALGMNDKCNRIIRTIVKNQKEPFPQFDLLQGSLALAEKRYDDALQFLEKAEKAAPRLPTLHQQIGQVYYKMNRSVEAERALMKALEIDPDSYIAHDRLAMVYLKMRKNQKAANCALNAVGLLFHYPDAHYHLGLALTRLGNPERAAQAFEVCLNILPGYKVARRILIRLYKNQLGQPDKAQLHQEVIDQLNAKGDPA